MTNNRVTLRDIYDAVNALESKVTHRIDGVEKQVDENTSFRNQLVGKITLLFALMGIAVNWIWDVLINRK